MIPRIIHQTWKTEEIPDEFKAYQQSWIEHHPDWEFRLWTDEDNLQLVEEDYPWLLETYNNYPFVVQRTDMARVLFLHKHGGLYVDLDFECFKPLDELLNGYGIVLGREYRGAGHYFADHDFACNALMASTPGHPFWEKLLNRMVRDFRPYRRWSHKAWYILSTTGPRILDIEVVEYLKDHDDLIVYPREYFYAAPYAEYRPSERRRIAQELDSHAIHHYYGSWLTLPQRFMRAAENWTTRLLRLFRRKKPKKTSSVTQSDSSEFSGPPAA